MALDMTSFDAALKEHYTKEQIYNLVYKTNPTLALIKKVTNAGGKRIPFPVIYGNPQNASADFATAQGVASDSSIDSWDMTRTKYYSHVYIDNETLHASKGGDNAFMEAVTEIDRGIQTLGRRLAVTAFRSGWGDIGVIQTINSSVIQLATVSDVHNFEKGMSLVFASTQASSTLRSATGVKVTAVNRSQGTVTIASTPGGVVAGDWIFIAGDREDSATPVRKCVAGFDAWLPTTRPSSTAFFGVDRSVDDRLAGLRFDGTTVPIEEALVNAANNIGAMGGKTSHFVMSYDKYAALANSLGTKVQYVDVKTDAGVGFTGIKVFTPGGAASVLPDQNCPSNRAYALQLDTWRLLCIDDTAVTIDDDGNKMLRQATSDSYEVRNRFYGNLVCLAPGYNAVISL